ncbi:MAG: HD family phosphohydrolase [Subdoligranulum sp.]|nr:HD family phosphohydrolase [Subdoligranulum sp.]MBD5101826.1 HD family phosphohydrolase [Subdoligranulum sp.]
MTEPVRSAAQPVAVPSDAGYLAIIEDLLAHPLVRSMQEYTQHGDTSCLRHCINVSYLSYLYCKERGWHAEEAARAGLLHDLFLYDWHTHAKETGEHFHGYTHPRRAMENAERLFRLTEREKDIILHHMWPLTITPPRSREAYVIVMFDKYCSLMETFHKPIMQRVAMQDFIPCPAQ